MAPQFPSPPKGSGAHFTPLYNYQIACMKLINQPRKMGNGLNGRVSLFDCDRCHVNFVDNDAGKNRIADLYAMTGCDMERESITDSGIVGISAENFRVYRSKINHQLEQYFGSHEVGNLEISARGIKPNKGYGIGMDRERIRVVL